MANIRLWQLFEFRTWVASSDPAESRTAI